MVRNPVFFCLARATVLLLKNEFHATRHDFVFISFIDTSYLLSKSWHIQDLLPFLRKTTIIFLTSRKYYCIHQGSPLLLKLLVEFFLFLVPVLWQLKFLHMSANLLMFWICECFYLYHE